MKTKLKQQPNKKIEIQHTGNIQHTDNESAEKKHPIIEQLRKESILQRYTIIQKWCNHCRSNGHSTAECRQNNKITKIDQKSTEN